MTSWMPPYAASLSPVAGFLQERCGCVRVNAQNGPHAFVIAQQWRAMASCREPLGMRDGELRHHYGPVPTATLNDTSVATPVHFTADEIPERTGVRPVNRCLTFALSAADPPCQV